MPSLLPQEVMGLIIDELGTKRIEETTSDREQRLEALRACSLAGWATLPLSRKHLFAEIHITQESGNSTNFLDKSDAHHARLSALQQILEKDPSRSESRSQLGWCYPTLAHCIRSLNLELAHTRSLYPMADSVMIYAEQKKWNVMNSCLPDILLLLTNVETFHLGFPEHLSCTWGLLDPFITSSFLRFLRSSSIKTLKFSSIAGLPDTAVLQCPNLRDLTLLKIFDKHINYNFSELQNEMVQLDGKSLPEPEGELSGGVVPSIRQLRITAAYAFAKTLLEHPRNALLFGGIQMLDFVAHGIAFELEWNIMKLAATSLQHLRLERVYSSVADATPKPYFGRLDFSQLPSLRFLEVIGIPYSYGRYGPTPVLAWDLLKKTTGPTSIKKIYVKFAWFYTPSHLDPVIRSSEWQVLDAFLTGPMYPNLEEVTMDLDIEYRNRGPPGFSRETRDELLSRVDAMLPALSCPTSNILFTCNLQLTDTY